LDMSYRIDGGSRPRKVHRLLAVWLVAHNQQRSDPRFAVEPWH
jgi:hypothetical protein